MQDHPEKKGRERKVGKKGSQIIIQELFHDAVHDEVAEQKKPTDDAVDVLDEEIHKLHKDQCGLPFDCGPVIACLERILKELGIMTQAFHGHSSIGNNCNKYLKKDVYTAICNSNTRKTFELTDNNGNHDPAPTKTKFLHLNAVS